ncbi:MAG: hypothetical protein ACSLFE_08420 [Gemmatimonadaceae bacterium]
MIDKTRLPYAFPTQLLAASFWEQLGRVVGTFGALEEVLGKAIFALTGTRRIEEAETPQALEVWGKTLEGALTDPLGLLIESFGKAVREHPDATLEDVDDLLAALRAASKLRNALCHGSWQSPDEHGGSKPLFVDKKLNVFDTAVDVPFLKETQRHAADLMCEVISTVTHMGIQFPGSDGPGKPVW